MVARSPVPRKVHWSGLYPFLPPSKPAWPIAEAIEEIHQQRDRQFDPGIVDAFLRVTESMPHVRV